MAEQPCMQEDGSSPVTEQAAPVACNDLGYGIHLRQPDRFIMRVYRHFFYDVPLRLIGKENVLHIGRIALFKVDQDLAGQVPRTTNPYWWAVGRAIGAYIHHEEHIETGQTMFWDRIVPFSNVDIVPDDEETAAMYLRKQLDEPIPEAVEDASVMDWRNHYRDLAEGVLLDDEDEARGRRNAAVFTMWVDGVPDEQIAAHPDVGFSSVDAVGAAIRAMLRERLWPYFNVSAAPETASAVPSPVHVTGEAQKQKKRFNRWYADPANRETHKQRARERSRRLREEERARRTGGEEAAS